jgi:hypothetical protein
MIHGVRGATTALRKVNLGVLVPKNKKPQWLSGKAHHGLQIYAGAKIVSTRIVRMPVKFSLLVSAEWT